MLLLSLQVFCVCVLCSDQRVFFDCGAKLDIMDVEGLIVSPGFPNNYSSHTHCVWQFFVPVGNQLTIEMFDFDVFKRSKRSMEEDGEEDLGAVITRSPTVWNMKNHHFNTPSSDKSQNSSTPTAISESLQPLMMDVCPDDVLYITDLIKFSSRFCGTQRPSNEQLVFGSDVEMIEVIMELITNTHWGRGFALIFRYNNLTHGPGVEVGGQRSSAPSCGTVEALLAAVSFVALVATSVMIVLCVTRR